MQGTTSVASFTGGLVSFGIFFVILIYASYKLIHIVFRTNPNVSSYYELNFFDSSEVFYFKDRASGWPSVSKLTLIRSLRMICAKLRT